MNFLEWLFSLILRRRPASEPDFDAELEEEYLEDEEDEEDEEAPESL